MIEVKKHRSKILLGIAILFVSCSTVERDNFYDKGGINYMGGSGSGQIIYGEPVEYGGETYETVVIGTQTWMARNLNYVTGNSKCNNDNPANCAIYGRLYDWAAMMALSPSCNSSNNFDVCIPSAIHRGICPSGWHIPSTDEWDTLEGFVGSSNAGTKLKASSGWEHYGNGTDNYGFAALPGGSDNNNSIVGSDIGTIGVWWTAQAFSVRTMSYNEESVYHYGRYGKGSVRCLKD